MSSAQHFTGPRLFVFSGAGLSAESGIPTFRTGDGIWTQESIDEVCNFLTWRRNREAVFRFYNQRISEKRDAHPNDAHRILAAWQSPWGAERVRLITQNIDDLLERAGAHCPLTVPDETWTTRNLLLPLVSPASNVYCLSRVVSLPAICNVASIIFSSWPKSSAHSSPSTARSCRRETGVEKAGPVRRRLDILPIYLSPMRGYSHGIVRDCRRQPATYPTGHIWKSGTA
ncbi:MULTISPECIES: SIR2 family NAD-dependent protein deacylase [Paraburkholderia]|uniref:SIR2 family NAD-dependent protein deacylase n=1 Tax=Paraburkholderia TaxID=1822464 RepID=UPI0028B22F75|nr:Sir2 family NAD-dependent protein deacetylase [Paraburkholderia podalyriae]